MSTVALGLGAAFAMAFVASLAPTGPLAALVLERSVRGQHRRALAFGVGGAAAEAGWAAVAVLGVSVAVERIPGVETVARALGWVVPAASAPASRRASRRSRCAARAG